MLRIFEQTVPPAALFCPPTALQQVLGGPAIITVAGERQPPLFVSVLLHGNEVSGWHAVQRLLRRPRPLPRALTIFVANVTAAAENMRFLPNQPDYNRIWQLLSPSTVNSTETRLVTMVRDYVRAHRFFAAVDLHNNSGHNPYYAVLTDISSPMIGLAQLFSRTVLYMPSIRDVFTRVFDGSCPALSLELGIIGDPASDERAYQYIQHCLCLKHIPRGVVRDSNVYEVVARVRLRDGVDYGFEQTRQYAAVRLAANLASMNFRLQLPRTRFALTTQRMSDVLQVDTMWPGNHVDTFFTHHHGIIMTKRAVIPAMATTNITAARQDCLSYFIQPLQDAAQRNTQ